MKKIHPPLVIEEDLIGGQAIFIEAFLFLCKRSTAVPGDADHIQTLSLSLFASPVIMIGILLASKTLQSSLSSPHKQAAECRNVETGSFQQGEGGGRRLAMDLHLGGI